MQWTLVTGAAHGLGAAICEVLAKKKHHLLIHYRNSEQQANTLVETYLKEGIRCKAIQGDFSSTAGVEKFIQDCSSFPIKYLINNVGEYLKGNPLETPVEEWAKLFQTNLNTPIALCQAFSSEIVKWKGSILNIGVAGLDHIPSDTYTTAYSASKLSLLMFTKALAKQLASSGVNVNMLSLGYLEISVDLPKNSELLPMKRLGKLSEAAEVAAFLLDENNRYITGQNLEIAGGVRL